MLHKFLYAIYTILFVIVLISEKTYQLGISVDRIMLGLKFKMIVHTLVKSISRVSTLTKSVATVNFYGKFHINSPEIDLNKSDNTM